MTNELVYIPSGSSWGNEINRYMREIQGYPLLSVEEEYELSVRYVESDDVEAARKLVLGNLRFVVKVAYEYRRYGIPLMELVQEGNLGLMQAVQKYDPYKGYRLLTYAVWWIRAYLQRYVLQNRSLVRRGTTRAQRKVLAGLKSTRQMLAAESTTDGPVTDAQVAEELGVQEEDVRTMSLLLSGSDMSLDAPIGEEAEGGSYIDFMADSRPDQEAELIDVETHQLVAQAVSDTLGELNEREQTIVEERLMSDTPATLNELAERFGLSRERVRQIETGVRKRLAERLQPAFG